VGAHRDLLGRHRSVMPSWLSLYYDEPIQLASGKGLRVVDGEGREYLDFFGGILTTISGYGVEEVVDAVREQAGRMMHTSTLYLIEPMVALAERIAALSTIPDARVFFVSSGTEANEAALLFATSARRSNQILALRNSYHGRSFAALGVTGIRGWSPSSLSPLSVGYVHNGYRYRSPFGHLGDEDFVAAIVADLRDVIATATAGDVACFIAEPIQGVGGFAIPPDGMLGALQAVLREHGILYISDEVQTGWGRTGEHFWGFESHGVAPDLVTFAKGLGNGLAIGGVVGRAAVIESIGANSISTFGGNPLSAAGALANLEYLLSHDLQANARRIGRHFLARLAPLVEQISIVGEVRGRGLCVAIELADAHKAPLANHLARVHNLTKERGLLVGRGGSLGNVLRIAPPMSITAAEADEGIDILIDVIEQVDRESPA